MRINPAALERLRAAALSAKGLSNIFESMLDVVKATEPDCIATLNLDYQDKSDPVEEGDLIPVISISLRPATLLTNTIENPPA